MFQGIQSMHYTRANINDKNKHTGKTQTIWSSTQCEKNHLFCAGGNIDQYGNKGNFGCLIVFSLG